MSLVLVLIGVVGVGLFGWGLWELRTVYHILTNDPIRVSKLSNREGVVEIEGQAKIHDGTVASPFTGKECLVYEYKTEERRSSGKHSHWETLDEGVKGVDFLVEDGYASVLVEPQGADIHCEVEEIEVSPGDKPPKKIMEYIRETESVEPQDDTIDLKITEISIGNRQRFIEKKLLPGEKAYVYGWSQPEHVSGWGSGTVNAVIRKNESEPFVISDTSETRTALKIAKSPLTKILFGVLLMVPLLFLF